MGSSGIVEKVVKEVDESAVEEDCVSTDISAVLKERQARNI